MGAKQGPESKDDECQDEHVPNVLYRMIYQASKYQNVQVRIPDTVLLYQGDSIVYYWDQGKQGMHVIKNNNRHEICQFFNFCAESAEQDLPCLIVRVPKQGRISESFCWPLFSTEEAIKIWTYCKSLKYSAFFQKYIIGKGCSVNLTKVEWEKDTSQTKVMSAQKYFLQYSKQEQNHQNFYNFTAIIGSFLKDQNLNKYKQIHEKSELVQSAIIRQSKINQEMSDGKRNVDVKPTISLLQNYLDEIVTSLSITLIKDKFNQQYVIQINNFTQQKNPEKAMKFIINKQRLQNQEEQLLSALQQKQSTRTNQRQESKWRKRHQMRYISLDLDGIKNQIPNYIENTQSSMLKSQNNINFSQGPQDENEEYQLKNACENLSAEHSNKVQDSSCSFMIRKSIKHNKRHNKKKSTSKTDTSSSVKFQSISTSSTKIPMKKQHLHLKTNDPCINIHHKSQNLLPQTPASCPFRKNEASLIENKNEMAASQTLNTSSCIDLYNIPKESTIIGASSFYSVLSPSKEGAKMEINQNAVIHQLKRVAQSNHHKRGNSEADLIFKMNEALVKRKKDKCLIRKCRK